MARQKKKNPVETSNDDSVVRERRRVVERRRGEKVRKKLQEGFTISWAHLREWRKYLFTPYGLVGAIIVGSGFLILLMLIEFRTSYFQSIILSNYARNLTYKVQEGESEHISFPNKGPFDQRLGYADLPQYIKRLKKNVFTVKEQASLTLAHEAFVASGFNHIYPEKGQAGLRILDKHGELLFSAQYPKLFYETFDATPPIVWQTLLLIENRELLDLNHPHKNPVIEWDRLAKAVFDLLKSKIVPDSETPGGSTLATQIEKYRHSSEGRTSSVRDKFFQMGSAMVRAYQNGPYTLPYRQKVVLDYINTVPLGAIPGFGEVIGIGHGLVAWFGVDFNQVSKLLVDIDKINEQTPPEVLEQKALAYKQILSLFLAQRRPAYYLGANPEALKQLTQRHLSFLVQTGLISEHFRKYVENAELVVKRTFTDAPQEKLSFLERKAANSVRIHLLSVLGLQKLYSLDRLDVNVQSSIDVVTQRKVTEVLKQLKDDTFAKKSGLIGEHLLASGASDNIVYSFTLQERLDGKNLLRVQSDNIEGPFDINEGAKLELGSTAKLRALVDYLESMVELYLKFNPMTPEELKEARAQHWDVLSLWSIDFFINKPKKNIEVKEFLKKSLERTYSANPWEAFFTGGGIHHFSNFDKEDNGRTVTIMDALRKSINLPFVRLMRDVVNYKISKVPDGYAALSDVKHPERKKFLMRFASLEGKKFLGRFYLKHYRRSFEDSLSLMIGQNISPRRYASIYLYTYPDTNYSTFKDRMLEKFPSINKSDLSSMFRELMRQEDDDLVRRAFIAKVHPLELFTVGFLQQKPYASLKEVLDNSRRERLLVYRWLFDLRDKSKQDLRIKIVLETDAFRILHKRWRKLGYPFRSLVPTLATALGSSGDRPSALAELMGIVSSGGLRYPSARIESMHFAKQTPFETKMVLQPQAAEIVMREEVAITIRDALTQVVQGGTAVRIRDVFKSKAGKSLKVGGKTGTGDNRYQVFSQPGKIVESRVMSRTATFVFYIGDKFFGTITAFVPSKAAANYSFTSALPVQILRILAPTLTPLIQASEPSE